MNQPICPKNTLTGQSEVRRDREHIPAPCDVNSKSPILSHDVTKGDDFMRTVGLILSAVSVVGCGSPRDEELAGACPSCSIRIEREVVIGDDGNGIVGGGVNLVQLGDRYYVSTAAAQHEIMVFDLAGRLVRSMGGEGPGPMEFSSIQDLDIGPDGNLWIFHTGRGLTVIDTLGAHVDTHSGTWISVFDGIEVLSDSTIIMNAVVPTPELVGKWVHAWKPGAGMLWSLDDEITVYQRLTEIRHVAPYMDGFWLAWWADQFRLLQYNMLGELIRELRPVRPWFEDFKVTPPPSRENEGVTDRAAILWPGRVQRRRLRTSMWMAPSSGFSDTRPMSIGRG